jgi:hypothetical protein
LHLSSYEDEDLDSFSVRTTGIDHSCTSAVIQHIPCDPVEGLNNVPYGITIRERVHFLCLTGVGLSGRRSTSLSESSRSVKPSISKFSPPESFSVTAAARLVVTLEVGYFLGGPPRGFLTVSSFATRARGAFLGAGTTGIVGIISSAGSSLSASAPIRSSSSSRSDSSN